MSGSFDLSKLNEAQRAAAMHDDGPILVLAGAGSGKTRVITHRIARLVRDRAVRPDAILAVSFTNKAAEEMRERMEPLIGLERSKKLWASTFHSFGVRFLSEEARAIYPDEGTGKARFVIFDQADCIGLVREIVRREGIGDRKLDLWNVQARISLWKNKGLEPDDVPVRDYEYDAIAREVYPHYEAGLRSMRALDFDDLVCAPARILAKREDIREKWRARFRYVLVDEFQDTNHVQLELVRLIANERMNVCVVGDDDQSIYGWRGAEVGNILDFERHFPGARVVKLEENYRSRGSILDVANAAMARASGKRHDKVLRATKVDGDKVRLSVVGDAMQEARFVAQEIRRLRRDEGKRWSDVAVLYRSNLQARLIEEELRVEGIPYEIYGGTEFFDRKEVKDAVAYMRCVIAPRDELSLRRILNYPTRGIGDTTVTRVERWALAKGVPFPVAMLDRIDIIPDVPEAAKDGVRRLRAALEKCRQHVDDPRMVVSAATQLFDDVGLRRELAEGDKTTAEQKRWANVEHVLKSLARYAGTADEERPSLAAFLQRIMLRRDDDEASAGDNVILSSLHGAKGLEWPVVFLIGLNEGTLPHSRTTDPKASEAAPTDVEEERRLFYVGVTRAEERLYLCRYLRKEMRGKHIPTAPSRFLEGLPEHRVERYERDDDAPLQAEEHVASAEALLSMLRGR